MQLKRNGNGNGKKDGHNGNGHNGNGNHSLLKIVVLAIAIVLVAVLAWRQVQRWRGPTATVWIASTALGAGSRLGPETIRQERRRAASLPAGAISNGQPIAGRQLARPKRQGEPIIAGDLAQETRPASPEPEAGLSELLPEGRVMMRVPIAVENVLMRELRRGDRLDVLAVTDSGARVIANDVYMLAYVDPDLLRGRPDDTAEPPPNADEGRRRGLLESLISTTTAAPRRARGGVLTSTTNVLVALLPEHVLPITTAQAAGPLTIALHGRSEVRDGRMLSIQSRSWDVEYITGASRGAVEFIQ